MIIIMHGAGGWRHSLSLCAVQGLWCVAAFAFGLPAVHIGPKARARVPAGDI